ncbi:lysosomal acid lipase/cholesteryl ester hydrolase-like [Haemaphysalis longicornis]
MPAAVDHILNKTGFNKLGLVGFSQGFTVSLVFFSMCTEYNDKVSLFVGYAPVANITHFASPVRLAVPFAEVITTANDIFNHGALLVSSPLQRDLIATVCNSPLRTVCYLPLGIALGYNANQLNTTRILVYVANAPVGTSSQNALHFAQLVRAKNFVRYDFGAVKNLRVYSQITPPAYPLENIRAPVALFRGLADVTTEIRDYDVLKRRLQHVLVSDYTISDPGFVHLDFAFGFNATDILHIPMINLMRNYTSMNP